MSQVCDNCEEAPGVCPGGSSLQYPAGALRGDPGDGREVWLCPPCFELLRRQPTAAEIDRRLRRFELGMRRVRARQRGWKEVFDLDTDAIFTLYASGRYRYARKLRVLEGGRPIKRRARRLRGARGALP